MIRSSEVAAFSADIQATRSWAEVPLVCRYGEDFLQPPPRVFERTDSDGTVFSIKIWCEDAVFFSVDPPADGRVHTRPFLIETPCCETLNPVLLESDMHPGPEISPFKPNLLTTPNVRFLPHIHCQSASRQPKSKAYIPTISRYLDALVAQRQWLKENVPQGWRIKGPGTDASNLIRYLFLEMPSQREKILPLLNGESRSRTEEILDQYKRTYKNKFRVRPLQEEMGDGVVNGTTQA